MADRNDTTKHGIVVRTWRAEGRWVAAAEALPEPLARAAVARGDLPDTAAARAVAERWPMESASSTTEAQAVLEAVRRLLERGLDPEVRS